MIRRALACVVVVSLLLGVASPVAARKFGGVEFAESFESNGTVLTLRGVGRVYYMRFFEVYVGGLYLPAGVRPDDVLDDVPKRLELHYTRKITAEQFAEAAEEFLDRNLTSSGRQSIESRIELLHNAYRDVGAGDSYSLTYFPGVGTELALNGRRLVVIEGADFAAGYLSIWLGERSLSETFRDAVLGR